jgi:hypothetical protein
VARASEADENLVVFNFFDFHKAVLKPSSGFETALFFGSLTILAAAHVSDTLKASDTSVFL